MATDHNQGGRRPHYHRGRRGPDRRGGERRLPQQHAPDQGGRASGDQVDVEQIMRDIRARISQRSGIELSTQQIQDLAARRLEAILDPRTINPSLLDQLRRGAAAPPEKQSTADGGYSFEDTTLYESHRGILRFIRRLFNPLLKLFFNPNPLIHALHTQARINREAAAREVERERRQAEWNALHYEILHRLVTEVSRVSIEMQSLSLRIESLSAKVEFNERKVRALENTPAQVRAYVRPPEPAAQVVTSPASTDSGAPETPAATAARTATGEAPRRKRRRRRGRRGGATPLETGAQATGAAASEGAADEFGDDEGDEEEVVEAATAAVAADAPAVIAPEPAPAPAQAELPQPTPPPDEPSPAAAFERPDPGPPER